VTVAARAAAPGPGCTLDAVLARGQCEHARKLAADVGDQLGRSGAHLSDQLGASVDEEHDVFEVTTGKAVVAAAIGERLQLRCQQEWRRNGPDADARWKFAYLGIRDAWSVPSTFEAR
jgi:hypothetical protein